MKRILVATIVSLFVLSTSADAAVTDWPVVSQGWNIVKCLVTDAGKLTQIVVTHATQATTEVLTTLRDCVDYVIRQATPLPDVSDTHVEVPHE